MVTVHGLDHERDKWNFAARASLRFAESVLARSADQISVVSESMRRYFEERYDTRVTFIPNGSTRKQRAAPGPLLAKFGLIPNRYVFFASRLVPPRVFNAGHAEHYRIAAWKAVSAGRHMDALRLLGRALALRPALIVSDWHAIATAIAIVLPDFVRVWLAAKAKEIQRRLPEHHPVGQE